jgi:hypothetical protein
MNRIVCSATLFLLAVSASAADRFFPDPEKVSIATTGRIIKIDFRKRTLRVRASDAPSLSVRNVPQNLSQMMLGLKQRIGVTLPGGITIALPGHSGKTPSNPPEEATNSLDEYTVVVTKDTVFQDGADDIDLEDFHSGEVISIHGVLNDKVLTASRIAKWM